jgi:aspartyl-tRNA(Asn)/glutamyl-tRNA(Gln) amidotransferase subunit A
MANLVDTARKLASKKVTSRELTEQCLAQIENPSGQGSKAFLKVYRDQALAQADWVDQARNDGRTLPQFSGIPISIKDLFDVAGEVTTAGSHVLDEQAPAAADADITAHLRNAGFVIVGKCNMTEFAFSGLGVNAHYGTPLSPYARDVGHIPGGSSSGGAVSVADEMAMATIGTDTGGSCRIPAAYCGITGFKPTAQRVSQRGCVPLSTSLDSIGPLANTVSCCAVLDSVLAGGSGLDEESFPEAGLRFAVLDGYMTDHIEPHVADSFQAALTRLSQRGVRLTPVTIDELNEIPQINRFGGLVGAEANAWHQPYLESRADFYDPWVRNRILGARGQLASDYVTVLEERARLKEAVMQRTRAFDALVMPTVQITPPKLADMADMDQSLAANMLSLKNTLAGNFLDRPSISIPCHAPDTAPVGFMIMGESMADRRLLSIARSVEYAIRAE